MRRRFLALAASLAMLAPAIPASAATVIFDLADINDGTLTYQALPTGSDLRPGGTFSLPSTNNKDEGAAFIFNEGSFVLPENSITTSLGMVGWTVQSFLLHLGTSHSDQVDARGTFLIQYDPGEVYFDNTASSQLLPISQLGYLTETDPIFNPGGVTYPAGANRGIDGADDIEIEDQSNGLEVQYELQTRANGVDQVRFFIAAPPVPEPATWAMMIAGFGMVGGALRLRRRDQARATA